MSPNKRGKVQIAIDKERKYRFQKKDPNKVDVSLKERNERRKCSEVELVVCYLMRWTPIRSSWSWLAGWSIALPPFPTSSESWSKPGRPAPSSVLAAAMASTSNKWSSKCLAAIEGVEGLLSKGALSDVAKTCTEKRCRALPMFCQPTSHIALPRNTRPDGCSREQRNRSHRAVVLAVVVAVAAVIFVVFWCFFLFFFFFFFLFSFPSLLLLLLLLLLLRLWLFLVVVAECLFVLSLFVF